jgi:hypothetical protein
VASIEPEPAPEEREAILTALEPLPATGGEWAAAALREGVSAEVPGPFNEHDVCSLW